MLEAESDDKKESNDVQDFKNMIININERTEVEK